MILNTSSSQWLVIRDTITAVDSGGSNDPVATVTDRLAAKMTDASDVLLKALDVSSVNAVELRASFDTNARTATINIFTSREGETSVKHVASVALVAGTQTNADGRFYAATATVTSYWAPERIGSSDAESGTGIAQILFDKLGYERVWVVVSGLSGGNITIEGSGY